MNAIFRVERVTRWDRVKGAMMMLRWRVRKFLRLQPLHYMKWRVRKFFQHKPTFINNYIIRVK